jgi:hypothetical protein
MVEQMLTAELPIKVKDREEASLKEYDNYKQN